MSKQRIAGFVFFAIFFTAGGMALVLAILSDELVSYLRNREVLAKVEDSLEKLETLNDDYNELLAKIEANPELLERLGPAVLGVEPNDPNTVNPRFTPQQLEAAKLVLAEQTKERHKEPPKWLLRTNEPRRRLAIFLAGAFLILVAFIWFTPAETNKEQKS